MLLGAGHKVEAHESHVISLYIDGRNVDVPSQAKTVGEFIEKSKIDIGEFDSVEPDKATAIEVNSFRVRVSRARAYTVLDGKKELAALSAHTSARLIAESAGLTLAAADKVDFLPIGQVSQLDIGRVVQIVRSKQVFFSLYGSPQTINTNSQNVEEILKELGIQPAVDDEVSPALTTPITDGTRVFVNRKGISVVTENVVIAPSTQYVEDQDLTLGSTAVRDPGRSGKKVVTYEITTENGIEISRKEISSIVVEQPLTKIVARGRAAGQIGAERVQLMALAGILPDEYAAADFIIGHESGWCATKWQGQWGQCPSFYEQIHDPGNKSIGFGLCQSTPGIKMATFGDDWATNPVTQLKWCTSYARARYGSWTGAYDAWTARIASEGHGWW